MRYFILLGELVVLVGLPAQARGGEVTLEEITAAYQRKYELVETIRLDVLRTVEAVVPEAELFRHFSMLPPLPVEITVIAHRDGRLFYKEADPWSSPAVFGPVHQKLTALHPEIRDDFDALFKISYPQVRELADAEWDKRPPPSPRILVYDGRQLWEHRPEERLTTESIARQAFSVVDPERFASRYLPQSILDHSLFSFAIPGIPSEAEYRSRNRLPDLFASGGFRLADAAIAVDGAECILAASADQEQLYLDPDLEFAVRRRQWFLDGRPIYEFVSRDFEELADGLWLPRTVVYTHYGHREIADGKYFGRPVYRNLVRVGRLELNRPEHLAYFSVDVPAGAWVMDQTLSPLDAKGDPVPFPEAPPNVVPAVTYIQPADQKDLEETIRQARRDASFPLGGGNRSAASSPVRAVAIWFTVFTVGVAAVLLAGWGYRRMKGP